jgi:hypothetical protein
VISLWSQFDSVIGLQFLISLLFLPAFGMSLSRDDLCEGASSLIERLWFHALTIRSLKMCHSFLIYVFEMPSGPGVVALIFFKFIHSSSLVMGLLTS